MIEPRILALGDRLDGSTASVLAGLFALLGSDFAQSAAMLRRAAEVSAENVPAVEIAAQAIEEQGDKPLTSLGIALGEALEATS